MTSRTRTLTLLAIGLIGLSVLLSCSSKPKEPAEVYTRRKQADSLMIQGHTRSDSLEFSLARSSYEAALGIYASLDNRSGTIEALLALGRNSLLTGENEAAEELYLHAYTMAERYSDNRALQDVRNHRADLILRRGDPISALEYVESGLITGGREEAARLRLLGSARYALGDVEAAVGFLTSSAEIAEAADEKSEAAQAYYKLASMASLDARFAEAEDWALQALKADKSAEYAPGIAADLRALAIISAKAGDEDAAADYYFRSWLAWTGIGRDSDAASAKAALEELTGQMISVP